MKNLTELVENVMIQNQPPNLPHCLQPPPLPRHNISMLRRCLPLRDSPNQPRRARYIEQAEEAIAYQCMRVPKHHAEYDKFLDNQGREKD